MQQLTGATHVFSRNHLARQGESAGKNGPLAKLMIDARGPAQADGGGAAVSLHHPRAHYIGIPMDGSLWRSRVAPARV